MRTKDLVLIGLAGYLGYVLYQHYANNVAWGSLPGGDLFTKLGLQGMGCADANCGCHYGIGNIAKTTGTIYGGYKPNILGSDVASRREIVYNSRN